MCGEIETTIPSLTWHADEWAEHPNRGTKINGDKRLRYIRFGATTG